MLNLVHASSLQGQRLISAWMGTNVASHAVVFRGVVFPSSLDLPTSRAQTRTFFFGSAISEAQNPKKPSEREHDLFVLQEIASSNVILGIVSVVCLLGRSVKHFSRNGKLVGTPTKMFVHVAVAENIWQQCSELVDNLVLIRRLFRQVHRRRRLLWIWNFFSDVCWQRKRRIASRLYLPKLLGSKWNPRKEGF